MSIFDNIKKSTSEIREQIDSETKADVSTLVGNLENFYSSALQPKMKAADYLRSALGWVYGCVNVIADEIAGIDLKLVQIKGDDIKEIDNHPALDLLYRANNSMTRFDLINATFQYLELTGEAPWYISFKGSKPDSIILLRPDRLTIKPGKDGEMIGGYKYQVYGDSGAQEIHLEAHEVIPLKYIDPDKPLRGKGPLQASAATVDLDGYSEKWNSQFFRNSATPSAALQTDKVLAKDVRARLEKTMKDKYGGIENSHKTMILEQGLKFEKLSLSQKDMDFIEQQRFSRDKILAIFRVPRTALGITDDVNRANAEATDYVFAKRTIKPKMKRFIEQLNEFFLPLFNSSDSMYFDFDDPVPQNVEQLILRAQSGVSTGYMTINEAREIMGMDPIDDGDNLRSPISFAPIPPAADEDKTLKSKRKGKKASRYQRQMNNGREQIKKDNETRRKAIANIVSESVTPIIYNYLKGKSDKEKFIFNRGTKEEQKSAKYEFQEKQLNVATEYEAKMIARLDTVFNKQLEIIQNGLDSDDKINLDISKEVERYKEYTKGVMIDMMREQARLAFQILGVQRNFDGIETKGFLSTLQQYFEIRTFRFATEVTKETNGKLQKLFADALKAGESIAQIKRSVNVLFTDMKGYRSERIARTETIRASNFATEEAYKESGVVEAKEWLATRDERTDDECVEMDGKIIPLGKNFQDRDENGYEAVKFPPIHVNCRCTLIPVIKA